MSIEESDLDTASAAPSRSLWLLSEARRSLIATVAGLATGLGVIVWLGSRSEELREVLRSDSTSSILVGVVVTWTMFCVAHTALTWLSYRDLRGTQLRHAARADPAWRNRKKQGRSRVARALLGYGPSSWASSVAFVALAAVVTMVLQPSLRAVPVILVLALMMVAVSWLNVAFTYAVHYIREDRDEALRFPGEPPERLLDYLYFAVGVQATFGSTDVAVRTSTMRDLVLGQSLLAFMFNTVIVGMVISLLLSAA